MENSGKKRQGDLGLRQTRDAPDTADFTSKTASSSLQDNPRITCTFTPVSLLQQGCRIQEYC